MEREKRLFAESPEISQVTYRPLRKKPYAQAKVITIYDQFDRVIKRVLRSYTTDVVSISYSYGFSEGVACSLNVKGLYSMTTRKHISAFMQEFTPYDYYTAKRCSQGYATIIWYE